MSRLIYSDASLALSKLAKTLSGVKAVREPQYGHLPYLLDDVIESFPHLGHLNTLNSLAV